MFSIEKDGYNKKQVDKKIDEMLKELAMLDKANKEKDKLNLGLANALEKTKEIEASAKNLNELKIQKILILYKSLEKSFNTLFMLYPQIEELNDIKKSFENFSQTVESTLITHDNKKNLNATVNTENDTFRLLLDKMNSYSTSPNVTETHTQNKVIIKRNDTKLKKKTEQKKVIVDKSYFENEGKSPAEEFLANGITENNAYTKILNSKHTNDLFPTPNESGFDLKEAVNPKDDLEEIMKAFNID